MQIQIIILIPVLIIYCCKNVQKIKVLPHIKKIGTLKHFGIISIKKLFKHQWNYSNIPNLPQIFNLLEAVSKRTSLSGTTSTITKPISIEALSLFGIQNPKYQSQLRKLQTIYGSRKVNQSISTMSSSSKNFNLKTTSQLYKDFISNLIIQSPKSKQQFWAKQQQLNKLKQCLFKQFQANDQSIVIMMLDLFIKIIKNSGISKQVLKFCGLSLNQRLNDRHNTINSTLFQSLSNICGQILIAQPYIFRIKSIRCAIELLEIINPKILMNSTNTLINIISNTSMNKKFIQTASPQSQKVILDSFKKILDTIYGIVYNKPKDNSRYIQLIQKWQILSKQIFIKDLKTYGLLPCQQNIRIKPQSPQFVDKLFGIFFLIRNLRYKILGSRYSNEQIQIMLESINISGNNLQNINKVDIGSQIIINQKWVVTTCFFKELVSEEYSAWQFFEIIFSDLLVYGNHFLLVQKILQNKYNHGKVILNCLLKSLLWVIDRSDPRKLLLSVSNSNYYSNQNSNDNQNNQQNLSLLFNDSKVLFCTKQKLQTLKNESIKLEIKEFLRKIEAYAQDLLIKKN